ncbi:PfkB family carbohydrate kinase [Mesomycoplasma molare]|uniref:PfkB family carbohydrate kinase n=1 Tax=Mesomycoplasma molare TaxID=171288 RepID=A0ABY5TXG9_9BACT|nr:PfkB family carbohydrate kinase [Mesomycoplasma molare]UWD33923.1 PfkB family carbohydrate kinase [Mesomycoplasma molare]
MSNKIYTLTLSPSKDFIIENSRFELNKVNRYVESSIYPGGKGINASIILNRHGIENTAISFYDNDTFKEFSGIFQDENLKITNIDHPKKTRLNIKFYGSNAEFELNGPKTTLTFDLINKLKKEISKLNENDLLLIMGQSNDFLIEEILEIISKRNINFVLDIDTEKIVDFLKYKPFLIKPNKLELEKNFNVKIENESDLLEVMKKIQSNGVKNIMVSLDKNGSYLLTDKGEIYKATVIKPIKLVSATGAGDTLISMFSANYFFNKNNAKDFFKLANASAMGTVNSTWLGNKKLTEKFLSNVKVEKLA